MCQRLQYTREKKTYAPQANNDSFKKLESFELIEILRILFLCFFTRQCEIYKTLDREN